MPLDFVVYRRDLPGGHIVILSLDQSGAEVVGRLQVERRLDPARRQGAEPPIVAEARGPSREAVLEQLRRVAESDAELSQRMAEWQRLRRETTEAAGVAAEAARTAARARVAEPDAGDDADDDSTDDEGADAVPADARRLAMPDGDEWLAYRQHERTQLQSAREPARERRLFVFFHGPRGAVRRAEIPEASAPVEEADADELRAIWARADVLHPSSP